MFLSFRRMTALALAGAMFWTSHATAAVTTHAIDAWGNADSTYESVHVGYDGPLITLSSTLLGHAPSITRPVEVGGGPLVVGNVDLGEIPALSDQTQIQRFLVSGEAAELKLTYLGLGKAAYKSYFGIYSYHKDDPAPIASPFKTLLFTQNVSTPDIDIYFTVPKDHYFGFYIDADGYNNSKGVYYTENYRNSDSDEEDGIITDHFLIFPSNYGFLLAIEDLKYDKHTGKLGDNDYQDMLVGFLTYADGRPIESPEVPEPASLAMVVLGCLCLLPHCGRARPRAA